MKEHISSKRKVVLPVVIAVATYLVIFLFAFILREFKKTNPILNKQINSVFVIILPFLPLIYGTINLYLQYIVYKWVSVKCEIVEVKYKYISVLNLKWYSPSVSYEYLYKKRKYTSKRFTRFDRNIKNLDVVNALIAKYKPHYEYECFVNENNPELSVLERRISYKQFIICLILSLIFFILVFIP